MARRRIELRLRAYEAQAPNHGPRDEINVGGSGGSRTRGLFDANEALFRLSYTPMWAGNRTRTGVSGIRRTRGADLRNALPVELCPPH